MQNRTFPRWMAPLVGVVVGVLVSLRAFQRDLRRNEGIDWRVVAAGIGIGFMAGLVLWLMDAPSSGKERPATPLGWFLVISGWLVIWIPVANVVVTLPAFLVNRHVTGWPNKASRAAVGIALLISGLVVALFVT